MQGPGQLRHYRPCIAKGIGKHHAFRFDLHAWRWRHVFEEPRKYGYIHHLKFHDLRYKGSSMTTANTIQDLANREYKWGFVTVVDEDRIPKGLSEDTIRLISAKKNEPEFMLEWRLKAYRHWATLERTEAEPTCANVKYPPIDYQAI